MCERAASTSYEQLLVRAYDWGRADGSFAADFEPPAAVAADVCRGRGPAAFARLLWGALPGMPPAGLEHNAPHWYAAGFMQGLRAARRRAPAGTR